MTRNKIFVLHPDKELPILIFLWRVKVATTAAITLRFYPDFKWADFTAYQRMLKLKKKGCVEARSDETGHFKVWTLTARGFNVIKDELPGLKENGFLSENIRHDLYVLAAHYGDWIARYSADDVLFLTEQELRRFESSSLPAWAKPFQEHKPDGLWCFLSPNQNKVIALELEISRKKEEDYKRLVSFYSETGSVDSVIWIVKTAHLAQTIQNLYKSNIVHEKSTHSFILFDQFIKQGWMSEIFLGANASQTMSFFLNSCRLKQHQSSSKEKLKRALTQDILSKHLCRFNSGICRVSQNSTPND